MNTTSSRTDAIETAAQEEPAITLRLTRSQVLALLVDAQESRFPTLDSSDATVTFFSDLKTRFFANRTDGPTAHWAQIKERHEGARWQTVGASHTSGHDAAWGNLTNEMQRKGLRYGELAAHIADMENGEELMAEDGTQFRILKEGQDATQ